jgi:glycosyltransferase involved in cell wall biosynthesis
MICFLNHRKLDFEVVIVEDKSPDGTLQVFKYLMNKKLKAYL